MDKALAMIGLCMKAGQVVAGEFSVENGLKKGNVKLVIIATDASDNTKKKFRNMCDYREVPYYEYADKSELGHCIGKESRASIGICDDSFAKSILEKLKLKEN